MRPLQVSVNTPPARLSVRIIMTYRGALIAADLEAGAVPIRRGPGGSGEEETPSEGAMAGSAPVTREVNKAEYVLSVLLRLHKISYDKDVYVWAKVGCALGVYRLHSY